MNIHGMKNSKTSRLQILGLILYLAVAIPMTVPVFLFGLVISLIFCTVAAVGFCAVAGIPIESVPIDLICKGSIGAGVVFWILGVLFSLNFNS